MCLEKIKEQYDNPSEVVLSGYKVFSGTTSAPCFANQHLKGNNWVPLDKWIVAEPTSIKATCGTKYDTGFHVYTEEPQKIKSNHQGEARRVYMRKVHTLGEQSNLETVIAQELYVPSNPNAWPPTGDEPVEPTPPQSPITPVEAKPAGKKSMIKSALDKLSSAARPGNA